MTTHVTTSNPVRSDLVLDPSTAIAPTTTPATANETGRPGRLWAAAGIGAALTAIASSVSAGMVGAVYDPSLNGDAEGILAALEGFVPQMIVFHVAGSLTVLLLAVFGLGLVRRLRAVTPSSSMAPAAAGFGLLGTSVVLLLGGALDTEFIFGIANPESVLPETAALYNHWIGTVPGCWMLVGISALAVFSVARSGGVPRWLGRVALVLGGLTVILGALPVQYMAGLTGTLWLLVTAVGFVVGDRRHRGA